MAKNICSDMQQIRFQSTDNREKEFVRAVRTRVRQYFKDNHISTNADLRMYFKTIVLLALYLAPFVLILTVPMAPWTALGMTVLIGIGEGGVGMSIMHDAAHGSYSSHKQVNKMLASTMFLLGSNTFNWKIQHNIRHHTFTNVFKYDPDISTKAVIRLCAHAPLHGYHKYQHIYAFPLYGLMTILKLFTDFFALIDYNKQGITKEQGANPAGEIVKLIVTKILYFAIIFGLPLWLTDFTFWQILVGFLTMHLVAGMIMSTVFQMAHVVEGTYQPLPDQDNIIHSEWLVHEVLTASDFGRKNGLLSWYIGGLDYQIEHHLFPNICHIHYPAIAPIVEETIKEYGFDYNIKPSFLKALASHRRRLKELGRDGQTAAGKNNTEDSAHSNNEA